jgi:fatty-acyl-CoA synthase
MTGPLPSYAHGANAVTLLGETIGQRLDRTVEQWGDREALIASSQGIRWTWRELSDRVEAFAAGLLSLGLEPGDRIGIWSPNNAEWVVTQFASAKAGLILVTINPAYRTSELEYALNKVGCKALVLAPSFRTSDYAAMLEQVRPKVPLLRHAILTDDAPRAGFLRYRDVESSGIAEDIDRVRQLRAQLQPEDAINIQFTSGTTGLPKGATLSHHNIVNNGYFVARRQTFTENDRLCIPVPLYHCFGMVMGVLGCVTHGAAMIFPAEAFEPKSVLDACQAERCTALYGVPTMFIAELDHPDFKRYDLSTLRTGVMAGAPCPVEFMKRVISDMHMSEVTICYGMTETSPVSFQSCRDDSLERRVSTVGTIHPHLEVKIVDADGRVTPRGERGELLTRGYSVMHGYWDDEAKTRQAIDPQGWMHTGDLATLDEAGYCNIVGRVKDLIIRGGENISPREVEEFLYRHPQVQDVQVFGVPDRRYGEVVCAWIKLKAGERCDADAIRAFCREQIAHYKVPAHIRFVEQFPMTVTGKIQKYIMRQQMSRELAVAEEKTA